MLNLLLKEIWNIWLELAPWLLLGALVAGILHVLVPPAWLRRNLSGRWGVLKAVAVGIPLPLCSCGVIPVGLGLRRDGASPGASVGFLISTPQTGVDSILVSAGFLGWPFALLKVMVALMTGLIGGWLADWIGAPSPGVEETQETESPSPNVAAGGLWRRIFTHAWEMIESIQWWLLAGVLVSAVISTMIPANSLSQLPQLTGPLSLILALVVSLPMYICATASVPVAAALVASGFPPGAALVFLMAGPATNVATLGAVYRTLGGRILLVYLTTIIAGSLLAGLIFNNIIIPVAADLHNHVHDAVWWRVASGIFLAVAVMRSAGTTLRRQFRKSTTSRDAVTLQVSGMTCNGCAARLERELESEPDVDRADVSFAQRTARIEGRVSENRIREVISAAGFRSGDILNSDETAEATASEAADHAP